MTIKDWLEAGKPKNESFTMRRDFDLPDSIQEMDAYFRVLAHLIIESVKFYCNDNFKIEPVDLMFNNDLAYRYEVDGFPFVSIYSNGRVSIGAKITAL